MQCSASFDEPCFKVAVQQFETEIADKYCFRDIPGIYSLSNTVALDEGEISYTIEQLMIDIVTFVLLVVAIIVFQNIVYRIGERYRKKAKLYSDYTIKISGLPHRAEDLDPWMSYSEFQHPSPGKLAVSTNKYEWTSKPETFEKSLLQYIEQISHAKVADVCLVYHIEEFSRLKDKLNTEIQRINKRDYLRLVTNDYGATHENSLLLPEERTRLENQIKELEKYYQDGGSQYLNGAAFVTFEKEEDKMKFLSLHGTQGFIYDTLGVCGSVQQELTMNINDDRTYELVIEDAPEPLDLIWENQPVSKYERATRKIGVYLFAAVMISITFLILSAIKIYSVIMKINEGNASSRFDNNTGIYI